MNRDALEAYVLAKKNGGGGGQGKDGKDGKDGIDGKSAYEIAVENGFEGDESEWLVSLKGQSAYEHAIEEGMYKGTYIYNIRCAELANTDYMAVGDMILDGETFHVTDLNGENISDGDVIVARAENDEFEGGVWVVGMITDCVEDAMHRTTQFKFLPERTDVDPDYVMLMPWQADYDSDGLTDDDIVDVTGVPGKLEGPRAWLDEMVEDIVQQVLDALANQ